MEAVLKLAEILVSLIGPVLVVIVTARTERSRKKDEATKQLEKEHADARDKKLNDSIEALQKNVEDLKACVSTLDRRLDDTRDFERETRADVKELAKFYKINTQSSRELAALVMTLAEGMRDQHLDGNVTQAIAKYRQFEKSALDSYMTTPPDVDDD